jgi:hypothetical protein
MVAEKEARHHTEVIEYCELASSAIVRPTEGNAGPIGKGDGNESFTRRHLGHTPRGAAASLTLFKEHRVTPGSPIETIRERTARARSRRGYRRVSCSSFGLDLSAVCIVRDWALVGERSAACACTMP